MQPRDVDDGARDLKILPNPCQRPSRLRQRLPAYCHLLIDSFAAEYPGKLARTERFPKSGQPPIKGIVNIFAANAFSSARRHFSFSPVREYCLASARYDSGLVSKLLSNDSSAGERWKEHEADKWSVENSVSDQETPVEREWIFTFPTTKPAKSRKFSIKSNLKDERETLVKDHWSKCRVAISLLPCSEHCWSDRTCNRPL